MRTVIDYLERAQHFERLAEAERDAELKRLMQNQADGYRKLAERRATKPDRPIPSSPQQK
jgi:hypothetical protein